MNRCLCSALTAFAAVVAISLVGDDPVAKAGHAGCAGPGCFGYASCYGCDGCWGGRWGLLRHRRAAACHGCFGCAGYQCHGCYGCFGCAGSCAGCDGCWGCEGSACYGCAGDAGVPLSWDDAGPPLTGTGTTGAYGGGDSLAATDTQAAPAGEARLSLHVPAAARVFINDMPTTSTGAERRYVSTGLANGETYEYQVRVEQTIDGQLVSNTGVAYLEAGEAVELRFDGASFTALRP